jgi:hypothetical protein
MEKRGATWGGSAGSGGSARSREGGGRSRGGGEWRPDARREASWQRRAAGERCRRGGGPSRCGEALVGKRTMSCGAAPNFGSITPSSARK